MFKIAPALKDKAIFLGWIAGLVLVASLIWTLSFSFRALRLMHSTNRILAAMEDSRRLDAPLHRPFSVQVPLGFWYSLDGGDSLFFVFAIMHNGILVPCGVEISSRGELASIIPLGSHARRAMGRLPQGLVQVYARRIESAVARGMGER